MTEPLSGRCFPIIHRPPQSNRGARLQCGARCLPGSPFELGDLVSDAVAWAM